KRAQAYVTPIGAEEVCIVALAECPEDADFAKVLEELPELRERLCRAELASRERGAITAMHRLKRVTRGNVALVGDASGGVDAITGEGLRQRSFTALASKPQLFEDLLAVHVGRASRAQIVGTGLELGWQFLTA